MQRLRSYFLAGLITLLPLAISLFIFALLPNLLKIIKFPR